MLPTYAVYVRSDKTPARVRALVRGTHNERCFAANPLYRLVGVFPGVSARRAAEMGRAAG